MNHPVTKTLLALGCAGMLASTANAQLPTTYTPGDFVVGFRQVGTNTNSVVVDIGPINSFTSTQTFAINVGTTLSAQYNTTGAQPTTWQTDPNVYFSLVQTGSTTANRTNYVTSPQYLTGPNAGPATAWMRLTNSDSAAFKSKINLFGNEFTSAGQVQPKADPNAYANFMPGGTTDAGHATSANDAWGYFNPTSEGNFGQGTAGIRLDTIQLVPSSTGGLGTDLGVFSISADGNTLTFTPNAVPEPSTYAAMVLGVLALLGFQMKKARKSATKEQFA